MIITLNEELYEAKFNFFAVDCANKALERRSKALQKELKDDSVSVTLIGLYNSLVLTNDLEALKDILEFTFTPKKNGGLTAEQISEFLGSLETKEEVESFIDEVLLDMEESGFFFRTIQKFNQVTEKVLVDLEKNQNHNLEEEIEIDQYRSLLERAKERGLI